ncbi:hypothetical protein C5167_029579 [Papaver somniferum]|nr:hypothetical protein C5167_029579 [Papaver somniferum]
MEKNPHTCFVVLTKNPNHHFFPYSTLSTTNWKSKKQQNGEQGQHSNFAATSAAILKKRKVQLQVSIACGIFKRKKAKCQKKHNNTHVDNLMTQGVNHRGVEGIIGIWKSIE